MRTRIYVFVVLSVYLHSTVSQPLDNLYDVNSNGLLRSRRSPQEGDFNVQPEEGFSGNDESNDIPEDPANPEDGDEEEDSPINSNRPGYNFFPISFGGRGRSGGAPGVVAIANSFSTGRKGVANSMATAYGSPAAKRSRRSPAGDEPVIQDGTIDVSGEAPEADASGTELTASNEPNPKADDSEEDEEDDDDDEWPIPKFNKKNRGSFTFFPISFGGRGKRAAEDGYNVPSGGVVAIANSFSTGRGGVANSQAIAHGGPMEADDADLLNGA